MRPPTTISFFLGWLCFALACPAFGHDIDVTVPDGHGGTTRVSVPHTHVCQERRVPAAGGESFGGTTMATYGTPTVYRCP